MSPSFALSTIVAPAMRHPLMFGIDSPSARAMLLAIGMQESRLTYRRQIGGPARGLWQFELGGGVGGLLRPGTVWRPRMLAWCAAYGIPATEKAVYEALEHNDTFACGAARLLLWSDPRKLPGLDDGPAPGWAIYNGVWRPGKPHPLTWPGYWQQSVAAVRGET